MICNNGIRYDLGHGYEEREAFCIAGVGLMDGAFCMMAFGLSATL
jgi:hypothetical protein